MGSEGVSGEILEFVGVFHQRDRERRPPVGEDVFLVIARDLEREAMSVNIDVDQLVVSVGDFDRRTRE